LQLPNPLPQPVSGKGTDKVKDQLEASVCRQICRGDITLKEGQAIFLSAGLDEELSAVLPAGVGRYRLTWRAQASATVV
jgi:hypothetical protein